MIWNYLYLIFGYIYMALLYPFATILHGILLLNPFFFRKKLLNWFGTHRFLRFFSVLSLWFSI